ncbi:helix-turn-helix transcriptional regulator [uncultured Ornithinimicrobium sp.]|uniref:helix-turn-helix transcriptional regulator n=1 Tax=uncultured Ornithinimicrobium sp. TaxID=259307 RepID=UPI00259372AD|nr:helix-turn-helix transcriptional regulator [uncultured Ornithinimicrobium sp.]
MTHETPLTSTRSPEPVRLDLVDELVEHLAGARGNAVLEGALGTGLGTALRLCRRQLRRRHVRVADLRPATGASRPEGSVAGGGRSSARHAEDGDADPDVDLDEEDVDVIILDARDRTGALPFAPDPLFDRVGVQLLDELPAGRGDARVLLVCSGSAAAGGVRDVARRLGARHFVLRPWGEPQVRSFLEARGADPATAPEVTASTGGIPWLLSLWCGPGADGAKDRDERVRAAVVGLLDNCSSELTDAVLALTVGYPVAGGPPLPMAEGDATVQEQILGRVQDAGLLGLDGTLPPLVRGSLLAHASPHSLDRWRQHLVDDVCASGQDLSQWAEDLADQGFSDPRVDAALVRRATELSAGDPVLAASILRRATRPGPDVRGLQVELCRLLLLAGDVPGASAVLEELLSTPPAEEVWPGLLHVGLCICWVQDQPRRAVDLISWAQERDRRSVSTAEVAMTRYATGDRAGGDAALDTAERTPDLVTGAVVLTAEGLRASLEPEPSGAIPLLMQAVESTTSVGTSVFPADSPAAHAALVALHAGDLDLVRSVVDASVPSPALGVLAQSRLALLRAWADTELIPTPSVEDLVRDVGEPSPRDRLLLAALRTRAARRADDPARLHREWSTARDMVLRHPVSLAQLLPLAELCLVSARMHEFERVRPLWQEAEALLDRLGQPPLWATPFHWVGVLVALQLDRPQDVAPHAAALVNAADHWPLAGVLAQAGRAWVRVRARDVRPAEVEAAAQDLARVGRLWEGARLASHGAAATDDRKVAARLLECARALRPAAPAAPSPQPRPQPGPAGRARGEDAAGRPRHNGHRHLQLTEREREVAQLVLEGRTYRQVGEALYLSAKTVEHHVARIRRRSGASTREELLALLSSELGPADEVAR